MGDWFGFIVRRLALILILGVVVGLPVLSWLLS